MLSIEQVRTLIAGAVPNVNAYALPVDATFEESGMDSLDHASILLALQESYGLEFSDAVAAEINSIEAILGHTSTQSGAKD